MSSVRVCCIYYGDTDMVPQEDVRRSQKFHVKNPLPVCKNCLTLNVRLPGYGIDFAKKEAKQNVRNEA